MVGNHMVVTAHASEGLRTSPAHACTCPHIVFPGLSGCCLQVKDAGSHGYRASKLFTVLRTTSKVLYPSTTMWVGGWVLFIYIEVVCQSSLDIKPDFGF